MNVQGPDGSVVNFPDGTDPATIDQVMRQNFSAPAEKPGILSRVAHGADDAVRNVVNGMTLGYADKLAAGLDSLTGRAPDYETGLAAQRAQSDKAMTNQGMIAGNAEQIGGMLLPGGLAAKTVGLAAKGVGAAAPLVSGLLARPVVQAAGAGAGVGAVDAAGHDQDISTGAEIGAGAGALGNVAARGLGAAGNWVAGKFNPTVAQPTTQAFREAAQAAYHASEATDTLVNAGALQRLAGTVRQTMYDAGFDPILHPGGSAIVKRIDAFPEPVPVPPSPRASATRPAASAPASSMPAASPPASAPQALLQHAAPAMERPPGPVLVPDARAPPLATELPPLASSGRNAVVPYSPGARDLVPFYDDLPPAAPSGGSGPTAIAPYAPPGGVSLFAREADPFVSGRAPPGPIPEGVTLKHLDGLRQIAGGMKGGTKAGGDLGRKIQGNIDDFLDTLRPRDLMGGDSQKGVEALKEARGLWQIMNKSSAIDDMGEAVLDRTGSTGSGGNFANVSKQDAIRLQKSRKDWTPDEQAALTDLIRGTPSSNAARLLGKLSPSGNGLALWHTLEAGAAAAAAGAHFTGNPLGAAGAGLSAMAIPAAGMIGKKASDRATAKAAGALGEVIRNGGQAIPPAVNAGQALSRGAVQPLSRAFMLGGVNASLGNAAPDSRQSDLNSVLNGTHPGLGAAFQ